MAIYEVILQILIPIAVGFILRTVGLFGEAESAILRKFVIYVSIPFLVFYSMYTAVLPSFSQAVSIVIALPVLTLIFHLVGLVIRRLVPLDKGSKTALLACITFGNYGWLGWSAVYTVLGNQGLNQAFFFTLLWWPIFYGFGTIIGFGSPSKGGIRLKSVALVTGLPVGCIAVGILMNIMDVSIPSFVLSSIGSIGNTTIPLILISVGMGLTATNFKSLLLPALLISGIRLGLGPILGLLTSSVLPVGDLGADVVILLSAMPVATVTPILCDYFDMDRDLISVSIVLSTVLSLVTVPIVLSIVL